MSRIILKQIAIEKNERIDNPSQSSYTRFVGLEHYDSGEATIRRYGSTERLESTMKVFRAGDILVARRNVYLKRAATVDFDGLTSGDSIVLHIENEVYRRIIPFVLNTDEFWDYANQHADGSMSKRLSPKLLMEYEFSLPDDNLEQISSILWAMERVKTAYRELIAKTDELVKSQFIEMFGSKQEPKCHYVPLKSLTDVCSGGTPDRKKAEYWADGHIPWVKTTELQNKTIYSTEECITDKGLSESSAKIVPPETILVAMYGQGKTRGKTAFLGIEACTNQACACILPTDRVRMKFLWHYFISQYEDLRNLAKGSNQANLNAGMIKDYLVPLPGLEEQKRFEQLVEQSDKSKFEAQQAMENLRVAQKALMRQHLTK